MRKLTGETKVEKMGIIDATLNSLNHTIQGNKQEQCYKCGKPTRSACLICSLQVCPLHRKLQNNQYCVECN